MNRCTTAHSRMLQRVLSHDSVFYSACDDGIKNEGDLATAVLSDPRYIVLMPHKNTAFLFIPVNYIMYEMHVGIIEGDTRKKGVKHAIEAARWIFTNTPCKKLITYVPETHERAIMFAQVCGMEKKAVLEDAILKNGKLENLVLLDATDKMFNKLYGEV